MSWRLAFSLFCVAIWCGAGTAQRAPAPAPSAVSPWKTLTGAPPLVIANGGQSGLYPDQTLTAYVDALNKTLGGIALFCDVQLSKDGQGICRTNLDLAYSTNIETVFPNTNKTYVVNGLPTSGYFSIDFTGDQLLNNITGRQSNLARPITFDNLETLLAPEFVAGLLASYTNATGLSGVLWLNVENAKFYDDHKINMTAYVFLAIRDLQPGYVSATEVALLRTLRPRVSRTSTKTILRVPSVDATEPTTNQTYGSLLNNLTNIRTFASGILVPKNLIWPIDSNSFIHTPTTLVEDAHRAKLEVHAFNFQNDIYPNSFNYSFDPIKEVLYFTDDPNFSVDGVFTDFPTTASVATVCYAKQSGSPRSEAGKTALPPFTGKQVITHSGGDSGNFPGSTQLSYMSAIFKGADYIDCPVQMSKDGVPFCRQSPDLLLSTNVATTPLLTRTKTVQEFQDAPGVFTFDLTWNEISSLKAKIVSPQRDSKTFRDTSFDDTQSMLNLTDFLTIAKDNKVGVYLVLEKAYILNGTRGIDTVQAVATALKRAELDKPDTVIQSEDASVLRALRQLLSVQLIYSITTPSVTLTDSALEEVKQFAGGVTVPRALISPFPGGYLLPSSNVVNQLHRHNLSVLVVYFRNEFVALAYDFLADPTLELNTYVRQYGVDGIVTDFPETAKAYLTNSCSRPRQNFEIPVIKPGTLATTYNIAPPPAAAPFPPLSTAEPPLPPLALAPAPSPSSKSSSTNILPGLRLLATCLVIHFLLWQRQQQHHL